MTLFVTGHSYADAGSFSTQTTLIDLARGEAIADLEEFTVTRGERQVTAIDVNFWGVTFARDSDRFYATMATGGKTYLIEGSVKARSAQRAARERRVPVALARRHADRLQAAHGSDVGAVAAHRARPRDDARDAARRARARSTTRPSGSTTTRVLYGVDGAIWAVPADGGGAPRRFIAGAESPAVVRW